MASTMLIVGAPMRDGNSVIMMDVYTEISYSFTSKISSHVIEDGTSVSDNTVLENPSFSFGGFVSNHPVPTATGTVDATDPHRPLTMYNKLMSVYRSRMPFTFVTAYETFNNCVFKSISITESEAMGASQVFQFNASVEQIKIFKSQQLLYGLSVDNKLYDMKRSSGGAATTKPVNTGSSYMGLYGQDKEFLGNYYPTTSLFGKALMYDSNGAVLEDGGL